MGLLRRYARWAAIGVLGSIVTIGPITNAATLQTLQQEESMAQAKLAREQAAYKNTQKAMMTTQTEIASLNKQLTSASQRIGTLSQRIAAVNHNITVTQNLMASTQQALTTTQHHLAVTTLAYQKTTTRLVAIHKSLIYHAKLLAGQLQLIEEHGSVGYIDVVLGAHSFSDFLSRLDLLGQVAGSAAHQVHVIKHEQQVEVTDKARLKAQKAYLQEAKRSITQRQQILQSANNLLAGEKAQAVSLENQAVAAKAQAATGVAQRRVLMSNLQAQRSALSSDIGALQSRIAGIVSQMQSLISQFNQGSLSRKALFTALLPVVQPIAQQYGLSPALIIAVITQESGGNATITSYAGAIGLMQIEPATAEWIAPQIGQSTQTVLGELTNPQENVMLGSFYLHYLMGMYGGNVQLTLAAYNAGPGTVDYFLQQDHTNSYAVIASQLPQQTQQYVSNVEALYQLYQGW